jgi:hypothetical protein
MLQVIPNIAGPFCIYYNKAASISDKVERFKLTMTASMAYIYGSHFFEKPLNPILGETYYARCHDGSHVYMEQTSHHPPISHMLCYGPNN